MYRTGFWTVFVAQQQVKYFYYFKKTSKNADFH